MKFLVDNALSTIIAQGLQKAGFEATHVRDIGLHSSSDSVIFDQAFQNDQIIISADTDFGTLLVPQTESKAFCNTLQVYLQTASITTQAVAIAPPGSKRRLNCREYCSF